MPKVRVAVAGTVGKTVIIETDVAAEAVKAAAGATIGVDLRLEDGSVPNLLQLANALSVESREAEQWPFTFFNRILEVPAVLASLALLTDPNENRVLYWDDVANALDFADNLVIDEAANLVSVRSGNTLRILDAGNTDSVSFSHDGVDLNIVGVLTADINITGITSIQAGTVDVDFDVVTATSYGGILEVNLLDKTAAETISGVYSFTPGPILTALGTVGAPSRSFIGDLDTGDYSPGANIYAITVGGVEAIRWTGASAALVRWAMTTGIIASTTQTQGEGQLTGSWNEISTVANNLDVVTLPSLTRGEPCLIINTGTKKLQIFPFLGEDIGAGINNSVTVKANSSRYYLCFETGTSFDIATDFKKLQGVEIGGASDNDIFFRSGGDWIHTGGNLTWDGTTLTAILINSTKYIQLRKATTTELEDITAAVNTDPGKIQGAEVYNSTTNKPVYAVGNAAGDVWNAAAGVLAHTPGTPGG